MAARPALARRALAALLLLLLAVPATPQRAAPSTSALIAGDPSLALTLTLGERATRRVTLSNPASGVVAPLVFEANPPPAAPGRAPAPLRAALPAQSTRVDPLIAERAAAGRPVDFLVFLGDQADLSAAPSIRSWAARGDYVYRTLTEHARRSQEGVLKLAQSRGAEVEPLWIVNAVRVRGTLADAQALAGLSEVALLRAERTLSMPSPSADPRPIAGCNPGAPSSPVCWNIAQIGADRAWAELGVTGQGVTVAANDTGASAAHPALAPTYRGGAGGLATDDYSWYDPQGTAPAPFDDAGHGTHVLGTIAGVGDGSVERPAIGVAPGARWIAAQGCQSTFCTESDLIAAAQWLAAPTDRAGQRPRPDLRPMVINNSWGTLGGNLFYSGYIAVWRAAGIIPVFAAGNASAYQSPVCGSIGSPADDPQVLAVGALTEARELAWFSLRGPTADGRLKPELTAPGAAVLSSYPGDGASYRTMQGTSMAAPHVTGAIALLLSANPALIGDYDAVTQILTQTARPIPSSNCGAAGSPNQLYGHGMLDAYAAVARARVDLPWLAASAPASIAGGGTGELVVTLDTAGLPGPGTYQGRVQLYPGDLAQPPTSVAVSLIVLPGDAAPVTGTVRDVETGAGLSAMVGQPGGLEVATGADGSYALWLLPGARQLAARATGYLSGTVAITVTSGGAGAPIDLTPDLPRLTLADPPLVQELAFGASASLPVTIGNTGTRPLSYWISPANDRFGVWRSDEPDGPSPGLIALPESAADLTISASGYVTVPLEIGFPFDGRTFTETVVYADGMVAFDLPAPGAQGMTRCLPDGAIFFYALAPFRANLDPSAGGRVRAATLPDQSAFIVSYEQVPLEGGPPDQTYTFQALLYRDGRVEFRYGALAALPDGLSVGIQRFISDIVEVGCGPTTPVEPGLTLLFRPQPPASTWLRGYASGQIAPGQTAAPALMLRWIPPGLSPYRARLLLESSDPRRPRVAIPVELRPQPGVGRSWLPTVARP